MQEATKMSGYKTYLAAVAIGVITALHYLGIIDDQTAAGVLGLLTSLGLVAARVGTIKNK